MKYKVDRPSILPLSLFALSRLTNLYIWLAGFRCNTSPNNKLFPVAMKRSFQQVSPVKSDVDENASTMGSEPVASTAVAPSHGTNLFGRARKRRVLCRTKPSTLEMSPTLNSGNHLAYSWTSPLAAPRRCGDLEANLKEEALLRLVLSLLNVREHQIIRQTNQSWRRRVQTLDVDRLDLSARTSPVCTRTLNRACRGVLQNYSRVRRIDLSGQRSITDRDLLVLTSSFWAHLEEIVADDCLEISDFGLLAVLNAQSLRLRSVSVRRCKRVTGELFAAQSSPLQQLTGAHPSLINLNLDDTSVSRAFISRIEAQFPTLQSLSALHTPAHRSFFQQNSTLNALLHELQLLVSNELVDLPLLPALLDEFNRWCRGRRGREAGVFERTLVASGSRALLDVPLLLSGSIDSTIESPNEAEGDMVLMSPLLYACASGRTRLLPVILAAGRNGTAFDLENTDVDGHSPLSLAVANGFTDATRLLLRAGCDVNTRSVGLASPLYLTSEQGWDVLVDMLLDANAQRDCAVTGGATALCAAAKNGHRSTVLRLLAAERQAEDEGQVRGRTNKQQQLQALFLACEGGHLFVVSDLLLLTELDANVLMDENVSPLYLACQMGYEAIVSLLLERGADPCFRRPQGGVSCLYIAAQEGHDQIVRLLLHAGADAHAKMEDMSTALHIAARMGRKAVSRTLLRCGARLDDQTRSGLTALYIASEEGHVKLVEFLLEVGAARDLQTVSGATALFAAAHRGHFAVVEALLLGRASATVTKHNGMSPIDAAALIGDVKMTQLLLNFGARVGGLSLHLAERRRDRSDLQNLLRTRYYTQHLLPPVVTAPTTAAEETTSVR
ncbi:Ankyrin repeats (many copies) [Phytophthora infestans]|uniref:Ankyrin repeats (Many copies) n=1 Tax=Phytophthora infestans TaxID=4787 RepID=A0A8S9TMH1_PHYIN|nr:Ankyrin repeats (many copies) [Phytophthora infestans]